MFLDLSKQQDASFPLFLLVGVGRICRPRSRLIPAYAQLRNLVEGMHVQLHILQACISPMV